MARHTLFGNINSDADLHLIQQRVDVAPALPKLNLVDVPGADGSLDLTEVLGVGVKYNDRTITWTYALRPGTDWRAKLTEVSNALNGKRLHITLDDDPGFYYDGRLSVTEHASDGILKQITIEAVCKPYKLVEALSEVGRTDLGTSYKTLNLPNLARPVVPLITTTAAETTLLFGADTFVVSAGEHKLPGIVLQAGANTLKAKVKTGTGTIKVTYQEALL